MLAEYSANGDEICYYTVGADLVSQEINGKVYVYLYDGHGTVRALANESGKLIDTYTYDAFGNLISSTGSTANNYRYCGEQFDSTTGLYYLRARYMDTNTGRFISQDSYAGSTADPISLHKYLYANSNPVMYSDPSGYFSLASVVCASTIGDMLFYSVSSGMIAFGMKLIRELRNVNAGLQVAVNWSEVIEETVIAMLMGEFFFCAGALAISLSSAAIFLALGGSCLIFFAMNCAAAQSDWESGNYDLAILEMIFAAGSVIGAKNCFDSAGACVAAKTTAATTTTSTKNTTTANTNQRINDTKAKFQEAANQANKTVSGNGHVNGTKKHAAFKKIVDNFKNANYKTEISFLNGEVVKYGTKGSSRLDAVLLDEKGNIIAVFDLKTGNAKLSTSQIDKIHANLPEGAKDVPVIEIHPE